MKGARAVLERQVKEKQEKQAKAQVQTQAQTQAACAHHWVIESPVGPVSRGVCKICGAVKEFQNYQFDFSWEDNEAPPIGAGSSNGASDLAEADEEEAA